MPRKVSRAKKGSGKQKAPKNKTITEVKAEPVDTTFSNRDGCRYEPYREAEPEGFVSADPKDLELLDATAKELYARDRETLQYIQDLKQRTAAMLEHVDRNQSQLRAAHGAMERIAEFVRNYQKMDGHWTPQQLLGDDNFRATWEKGKMVVLDSYEPSDLETDTRYVDFLPSVCLTLRSTEILVYSLLWFVASVAPSPLSKSIFPGVLTWTAVLLGTCLFVNV
jgi:hypothetical protein